MCILYAFWIQKVRKGFSNINVGCIKADGDIHEKVSIVIPYRNENGIIQGLVNQLLSEISLYDDCEVILVNDHSTDGGDIEISNIISKTNANFKLIDSEKEGKKSALSKGISLAKNEWIVTLDADVKLPCLWLKFITKVCANATSDMIILPVEIFPTPKFFQKIEALEFAVLQVITFSYAQRKEPILANGAHLTFKKQAFEDFNGYSSHEHIASGDDVFLMEELKLSKEHSVGYSYCSNMLVSTTPSSTLKELIHQKIRWGGKTFQFKSNSVKRIGILILFTNSCLILFLFSGNWLLFFGAFYLKSLCDLLLLNPISSWGNNDPLKKYIPVFMVIYPFYITFVSIAALFIKPKWKGRKI